ncbi:MAG TPA: transcriptional regulator [Syntrophomonas sp.]|jgi:PAS domain S-box-containing protein|nr:transcriptional regulator [Syntrophomonas sp.]
MPNSDSNIPQAYENESLHQVAEKFLESSREHLNIVNDEGQVVGKITSRSLMLALAKNINPNTLVKTLVKEQIEMTNIDNHQDIPLVNDSNVLNAILEASSDGVLISDNKGNITYVNSAYEQITGLKKEQMIGQNLQKLLDEKLFNIAASLIVLEDGKPVSIMHNYITGKNALTTASPIYNEQGEIIGVFNNTRNISGLAMLRNELVGTNNHIPQHYFNTSQDVIQQQLLSQGFVFKSKIMMRLLELASKAAHYDSTVLIYGESGSGKEVLAKFIHQQSPRREGPFVKLNCAAIPDELFESELFGYEPGSFTGAKREGKLGMLELANQGTILLDEVSELSLAAQSKLLRAIQEREVFRVGASEVTKLNVRIIAASNKKLAEEVEQGNFREDLFFRLNIVPIEIPPLRERKEDIAALVSYFLEKLNELYKKEVIITPEVMKVMINYSWPGNVRELQNLIEYLFVINADDQIGMEQLPPKLLADHAYEDYIQKGEKSNEKLNYLLDNFEKNIIIATLKNHSSMRQAAIDLGINVSTLSRKMKKYGIEA